jgi:hypothetical protein
MEQLSIFLHSHGSSYTQSHDLKDDKVNILPQIIYSSMSWIISNQSINQSFQQTCIPSPQGIYVSSLNKIAQLALEKGPKM